MARDRTGPKETDGKLAMISVFISWSGPLSQEIAKALRTLIPNIF